jgi:CrcB protein
VNHWLAVAVGGGAGALARYGSVRLLTQWLGVNFPLGTLAVNVLGSLAAGMLYVALVERVGVAEEWRSLLIVGFLGGFTTFSAFSLETMRLLETGALGSAVVNVLLSVATCLGACALGLYLARQSF